MLKELSGKIIRKCFVTMLSLCLLLSILIVPQAKAQLNNPNTDWLMNAKYGVFVHYLGGWTAHGFTSDFQADTNSFNATNFANQMATAGAGYVIFTMNQNAELLNAPNAAYDTYRANGGGTGDATSNRDLVLDLYNALNAKGIKLMLYTTSNGTGNDTNYSNPASVGLNWTGSAANSTFQTRWGNVIKEWSDRYGSKVAGWWIDGAYDTTPYAWGFNSTTVNFLINAAKDGNANSIVAVNPGANIVDKISDSQDYTAGEINDMNIFPPGPPYSRWINGIQWHALTYLGTNWGVDSLRFSDQQVIDYVRAANNVGGVVSLDMTIYADGHVSSQQLNQLAAVKAAIKGNGTSLLTGKTLGTVRNNFTGNVGFKFTTGSAITVNQLGRYYVSGNTGTHTVSLYKDSDKSLLGSCSVNTSAGSADSLGFKYCTLSGSISLSASTAYLLVTNETSGGDQWYHDNTTITLGTGTLNNSVYSDNSPTWYTGTSAVSFGPVNLLYGGGGGALNRSGWIVNASNTESGGSPNNAIDGNINTRWSTGIYQVTSPYQWYSINMGSVQSFSSIVLDAGPTTGDYPRQYRINGSNDGVNWTQIKTGSGSGAVTTVTFPTQSYKYIGIDQTGSAPSNWWSIAELNVYP